jgi:hypothetical protein
MKHRDCPEQKTRVTVNLGEHERRALLARAADRTVAEHRPVSLSEVTREVLQRGLDASGSGSGRAA